MTESDMNNKILNEVNKIKAMGAVMRCSSSYILKEISIPTVGTIIMKYMEKIKGHIKNECRLVCKPTKIRNDPNDLLKAIKKGNKEIKSLAELLYSYEKDAIDSTVLQNYCDIILDINNKVRSYTDSLRKQLEIKPDTDETEEEKHDGSTK